MKLLGLPFLIPLLISASYAMDFPGGTDKVLDSKDGGLEVEFVARNDQKDVPLIISQAPASYGCIAKFDPKPIRPREETKITVSCSAIPRGTFHRSVTVFSNQNNSKISVRGFSVGRYLLQSHRVRDCIRTYAERQATGGFDALDLVSPQAGYLESEFNLVSEGFNHYQSYLDHGKNWKEKHRQVYEGLFTQAITCDEAIKKSLRAVWIGDSLSKNFHVSGSKMNDLDQARNVNQQDGIFDVVDSNILSFSERLSAHAPVYMINMARVGGNIVTPLDGIDTGLIRKKSLERQVEHVLSMYEKPHYIGIWLGHNDLDWKMDKADDQSFEEFSKIKLKEIKNEYIRNLKILVNGLKNEKHKVAINLYAMANVSQYINEARPQLESIRKSNEKKYPSTEESVYEVCNALAPEYRDQLAVFHQRVHETLKAAITKYLDETVLPTHIRIQYSEVLTNMDYGNLKYFHSVDGWHFSNAGKNEMGRRVFESSKDAFKFLGLSF